MYRCENAAEDILFRFRVSFCLWFCFIVNTEMESRCY
jgi:hypothetical protein